MNNIRALTIRQPWAALIAHDDKRVENRTWGTAWRGQLLIHAAKTPDPIERHSDPVAGDEVRSAIVATATLADCHVCDGGCSLWAEPGRHHWVLQDVHALPEPVPCSGSLGLWRPDKAILQAVAQAALQHRPMDQPPRRPAPGSSRLLIEGPLTRTQPSPS